MVLVIILRCIELPRIAVQRCGLRSRWIGCTVYLWSSGFRSIRCKQTHPRNSQQGTQVRASNHKNGKMYRLFNYCLASESCVAELPGCSVNGWMLESAQTRAWRYIKAFWICLATNQIWLYGWQQLIAWRQPSMTGTLKLAFCCLSWEWQWIKSWSFWARSRKQIQSWSSWLTWMLSLTALAST